MLHFKEGDLVKLVNPDSVRKFGEGPFKVLSLLPHINAVELDEIGSVDVSEITEADGSSSVMPRMPSLSAMQGNTETVTIGEAARRIESVAGSLLAHPDPNVRMSAKEILRLLWNGENDGVGRS